MKSDFRHESRGRPRPQPTAAETKSHLSAEDLEIEPSIFSARPGLGRLSRRPGNRVARSEEKMSFSRVTSGQVKLCPLALARNSIVSSGSRVVHGWQLTFTRPTATRLQVVGRMLDHRSAYSPITRSACCNGQMSETDWPAFLAGNGAIWEKTGFTRNWINGPGRVSCVGRVGKSGDRVYPWPHPSYDIALAAAPTFWGLDR
jgi:hypothetical protein